MSSRLAQTYVALHCWRATTAECLDEEGAGTAKWLVAGAAIMAVPVALVGFDPAIVAALVDLLGTLFDRAVPWSCGCPGRTPANDLGLGD